MRKFITIATDDLARLLELSAQYPYAVIDGNDNTDGEGKWHCDVEFYDEQGDEDPTEVFSFNPTENNYKLDRDLKWQAYKEVRDEYLAEDIKRIADERGVKLDDADLAILVEEYINDHDMTISERDMIENLVERYGDIK